MLKNITTKEDISAQAKIIFWAVIITLLVHGLLLVLFVYAEPPKVYTNAGTAGVTFMDIKSQSPTQRRQLMNWLEYHEPSLISAPNARHGYNQLNPGMKFRKVSGDMDFKLVLPEADERRMEGFEELDVHEKRKTDLSNNFLFHHFSLIPVSIQKEKVKAVEVEEKYPLIKNGETVLDISLSPAIVKEAERAKLKPVSINYDLTFSKHFPRVTIVNSSGSRDFDMRLLREFSLLIDKISCGKGEFNILVEWSREAAE